MYMRIGEHGFIPKPVSDIKKQFKQANAEVAGKQREASLPPPSLVEQDILKMPVGEIKQKYARRYQIYLDLIRNRRRLDNRERANLTEQDLEHMRSWLKGLNALDEYVQSHKQGAAEILREGQVDIFENLQKFIEAGGDAGYIKVPTGVGKTVLFIELIEALDLKTLIVVPSTPLVEQTEERMTEFAPDVEVGKIYAGAKQHGRQVTIITYDSLISQIKQGIIHPEFYDCLILDEAHMALGPKRVEAISKFKNCLKLGFTATPDFKATKRVSNLLPKEIHRMDIREGVEKGLLAPFSVLIARTNVDLSQVAITQSGDYQEEEIEKAINIASRNQAAVDLYKQAFAGETAVAYCVNVNHAEKVAALFNEQGVSAAVISGETPKKEQRRIKQAFKEGKIKILCNADILIPGFDEPRASLCLNLRPTRSRVIAEQRGGRVLRLNKNDATKHACIIDFLDQGIDRRRPPILFSDVADGAEFVPHLKMPRIGGGGGGKPPLHLIDIPGLEVIVDTEEVMRITRGFRDVESKEKYLSYSALHQQVIDAHVTSQREYRMKYNQFKTKGWPSNPDNFYHEWVDWPTFLAKEGKKFLTLEELKQATREAGITGYEDYRARYEQYPGWPASPQRFYANWRGWSQFLEKKIDVKWYKKQLKEKNITTKKQYDEARKTHKGWPEHPAEVLGKAWEGWQEPLSLTELQEGARKSGIRHKLHYQAELFRHRDWPSYPERFYGKQWPGWPKFLGKK